MAAIVASVSSTIPFVEVCTYEDSVASGRFLRDMQADVQDQLATLRNARASVEHHLAGPMARARERIAEAKEHIDQLCCSMKDSKDAHQVQVADYDRRRRELEVQLKATQKPLEALPLGRLFLRATSFCSKCPPFHCIGVQPDDLICRFRDATVPIHDVDFMQLENEFRTVIRPT